MGGAVLKARRGIVIRLQNLSNGSVAEHGSMGNTSLEGNIVIFLPPLPGSQENCSVLSKVL